MKTDITLIKNEILINEDEIREYKTKIGVLVDLNKDQDNFIDKTKKEYQTILNEQIKIKDSNKEIEEKVFKNKKTSSIIK